MGHILPWNETTRKQYSRKMERYESDLTDAKWTLLDSLLLPSRWLGRPRQVDLREVVNAIAYMLWTACGWRALPKDFLAFTTVQTYFHARSRSGVLEQVCAHFTTLERLRSGSLRRGWPPAATSIHYSPLDGLTCHDPLSRFGLRTGNKYFFLRHARTTSLATGHSFRHKRCEQIHRTDNRSDHSIHCATRYGAFAAGISGWWCRNTARAELKAMRSDSPRARS